MRLKKLAAPGFGKTTLDATGIGRFEVAKKMHRQHNSKTIKAINQS